VGASVMKASASRWLGIGLIALAAGLSVNSLLGPLVTDVIRYHVTTLLLNQTIGLDAVSLALVAPLSGVAGLLVFRAHPAAPVLAFAPAVYAAYMFPQYILGPDYLRLEGNNELLFPLHLALFSLGGAVALLAWRAVDAERLPPISRRKERLVGGLLLALAAFLVVRWAPALLDAIGDDPSGADYLAGPTFFWTIALLDLGVALPTTIATGVGLLRAAVWARKAMYAVVAWFALVGAAVAGMNVAMYANDDPNASGAALVAFTLYALVFAAFAAYLYRPLFRVTPNARVRSRADRFSRG
jgi:hypothetical protein